MSIDCNPKEEELCLVDSCTTNSILREIKYFQTLTKKDGNIMTIAGTQITLPMGTHITIEDALLYPDSTRTLLSYRDIRKNGLHVETDEEHKEEFLLLIKDTRYGKQLLEKIPSLPSRIYYTYIKPVPHV